MSSSIPSYLPAFYLLLFLFFFSLSYSISYSSSSPPSLFVLHSCQSYIPTPTSPFNSTSSSLLSILSHLPPSCLPFLSIFHSYPSPFNLTSSSLPISICDSHQQPQTVEDHRRHLPRFLVHAAYWLITLL